MTERQRKLQHPSRLLHLPLDLFVKISHYLSFADLWYLATSSRYCRALAHQIIWHKYHIDLSKPELNVLSHMVHAALAYVTRHGYNKNSNRLDNFIIQSVANRLAVEIYEKTPLKNWEPCLDFFLDKTLGIILDHMFLDPSLDVVPNHTAYTDIRTAAENLGIHDRRVLTTDFYPTRVGHLLTSFLTTFHPTLTALFETDSTIEIHHRLLLNHINRHLDNMAKRYHNHCQRQLLLISSSRTAHINATAAIRQHFMSIRLNFRIMIRFLGALIQTDLLSMSDMDNLIRQRIQSFYLIPVLDNTNYICHQEVNNDLVIDVDDEESYYRQLYFTARNNNSSRQFRTAHHFHPYTRSHLKKQRQYQHLDIKSSIFESLSNDTRHYFWQMWLDELEFQMETYLDLTRAVLALERTQHGRKTDVNMVTSMLDKIISHLTSKKSNRNLFMSFTTTSVSSLDKSTSTANPTTTTATTTV